MAANNFDLSGIPLNLRQGFQDKKYQTKGPGFKFVKGIAIERPANPPTMPRGEELFESMLASRRMGDTLARTSVGAGAGVGTGAPAYVRDARKVLRFETYFMEAVHESATEKYRVRKITLLYYLEDHTLQLNEHKVENSGIPQGTFVKRHLCPKGDGSNVTFNDLVIGGNVHMYGRTFRLVSCDASTRAWYDEQGLPQPEDIGFPDDSYTTLRETVKVRDTGADSEVFRGKKSNPLKRFMEASLGNASNVQRCGIPDSLKKFLENDRKVLRFYGVWDDRERVYGDRLFFRVHYFLSDDTMEVLEEHKVNSGRDRFPALLKRQRVSSTLSYNDDRSRGVEDDNGFSEYYTYADLCVGSTINILGRPILLYNADAFTFDWYSKVQGIDMSEAVVDVEEKEPEAPKIKPPPHTGFGSEEDSLSSFMFLTPKVPRRDFKKLMENDKKMLRFTAKLHNPSPIDASRKFIITYYLADDTVAVFEQAVRNSGIIGGKWMTRNRAKNLDTGKYFDKGDLFVGAVVTLKGHRFDVESADEFTLRLMENAEDVWPLSSINKVMHTLKRKVQEHSISARRMFRTIDKDFSGFITIEEFNTALVKWGMDVPKAAMVTIMRTYDQSGDGRIDYNEFCEAFLDQETAGGARAGAVRFAADGKVEESELAAYGKLLSRVELEESEARHLNDLISRFAFVFRTRKGEQFIREEFRQFDTNKNHSVDRSEFRAALGGEIGAGMFNLNDADIAILEKAFFPAGSSQLNYEDFMHTIRASSS